MMVAVGYFSKKLDVEADSLKTHKATHSVEYDPGMVILRPSFLLLWLVTFLAMLYLLTKSNPLRNYVIQDLLPIKELQDIERKTQRLYDFEMKRKQKQSPSLFPAHDYSEFEMLQKLNFSMIRLMEEPTISETISQVVNENKCTPEHNVAFIKTHKTGSSTVTNILNRYADLSELLVALPAMGDVRFAWPRKFHWSSVDMMRLDGQPANILTNHLRYNRVELNKIMEENTKYITILRDPVTQFESSFYYFEFDRLLRLQGVENPVKEFLKAPDESLYNLTLLLGDLPDTMNLIQNGMFYDLGYDFIDLEADDVIDDVLHKLDNEFQLVLLMEYFDESLVLLKHEFCWDFDDLLYIKQNQRHEKRIELTTDVRQKIRQWNHADTKIYDYFNRTFWKKVKSYGESFSNDLKEFRVRNKNFERICSPKEFTQKAYKINVKIDTFVMEPTVVRQHRYLCQKVLMNEVEYLRYFRKKFQVNFGYQKLLIEEGIKPNHQRKRLVERLKKSVRKKPPKFLPLKGFERKK